MSGAGGEPTLFDFPRRWPAVKIATNTPTAPSPIRTQTHHDRPPPEPVVPGAVCVTCAFTDVEFVTDAVTAGFVPVCVPAVPLADWVFVSSPVALETAPVAAFAALDAALLADPDPQPLTSAVAMPSASKVTTSGRRAANLTTVTPFTAARVHTPARTPLWRRRHDMVFRVVERSFVVLGRPSSHRPWARIGC